jgi:hypothetical protein
MQILEIRNLTERHRDDRIVTDLYISDESELLAVPAIEHDAISSLERIMNGNHHDQSSRRSKPMQRSEAEQRSVTGTAGRSGLHSLLLPGCSLSIIAWPSLAPPSQLQENVPNGQPRGGVFRIWQSGAWPQRQPSTQQNASGSSML